MSTEELCKELMDRGIRLEALVCEREGMMAENNERIHCGEHLAYLEDSFQALAAEMRLLLADGDSPNNQNENAQLNYIMPKPGWVGPGCS